ncbi:hypothetical protein QYM36_002146 [Artemia franciscana]|uniref:PiggyBac transposable element-derived protein domain-containing protein n=1 Tax=Artemia franciscana TaxID=6661 RepID=A0AA88L9S6_ARTSF|nr:hypothetical protein QYM36_002146 [Artemia franciscana]
MSFCFVKENNDIAITQWFDSKPIFLAFNCHVKESEVPVMRYDKTLHEYIEVPSPQAVCEYNKYMGDVAMRDKMISYNRFSKLTRKWTIRVLHPFIDLILFHVGDYFSFEAYRVASNSFVEPDYENYLEDEEYEGGSSKRRRQCLLPLHNERTVGVEHLPRFDATLKKSERCRLPGCEEKPQRFSEQCQLFLWTYIIFFYSCGLNASYSKTYAVFFFTVFHSLKEDKIRIFLLFSSIL